MSNPSAESLDARLVRFRSRGAADDAEPLARALLAADRHAEAAEVATAFTAISPDAYATWELLAIARSADGDSMGAQKAWLEAVRRFPERPEPYRAIATILISRGDLTRAEKLLERGIERAGADEVLLRQVDEVAGLKAAGPSGANLAAQETTGETISPLPGPLQASAASMVVAAVAPVPVPAPDTANKSNAVDLAPASAKSVPPVGASIRPRAVIFTPVPPSKQQATSDSQALSPRLVSPVEQGTKPAVAPIFPAVPVSNPPSQAPIPGAAIRPRAVIFTPTPPPLATSRSIAPPASPPVATKPVPPVVVAPPVAVAPPVVVAPPPAASALLTAAGDSADFDDDGATRMLTIDPDLRAAFMSAGAATATSSPVATTILPADSIEFSAVGDDVVPASPEASTMITRLEDLVALRKVGAILPSAPPTQAVGANREASDGFDVDVDADADAETPEFASASRQRGDATVPYTRAEEDSIAQRLIPVLPSTPPDLDDDGQPPRPSEAQRESARPTVTSPPARSRRWIAAIAVIGLGVVVIVGLRARNRRDGEARLAALEAGLLSAQPTSVRDALDAAALTDAVSGRFHRDLKLEAILVRYVTAGGVSADSIRAAAVTARARSVQPAWIAAATAAEAVARGDMNLAERSLSRANAEDPRLALVRGRIELALGHAESSRVVLTRALRIAPGSAALVLALADVDRSTGDDASAASRLDLAIRADARHPMLAAARVSIALDAGAPVDVGKLARFESHLAGQPSADRAFFDAVYARAKLRAGGSVPDAARWRESVGSVRLALPSALEVAALDVDLGAYESARAGIVASFGPSPGDRRARRILAAALAQLGRGAEALALLEGAGASANVIRSQAALHASPAAARAAVAEIDALGADMSLELRALELRLRLVAGDPAATVLSSADALRAEHPDSRDVLVAYASCAAAADRWELLSTTLDPALRTDPQVAAWLGQAAIYRGDRAAAEAALLTLDASAPEASDTLVVRGYVQIEKAEFDNALATYAELASRSDMVLEGPSRLIGSAGGIITLLSAGRVTEAHDAFARLASTDAEHPALQLASARLAVAEGRGADAIPWLETRASAAGASPGTLVTYADALFATGRIDRASEVYREVVAMDGSNPEAQLGIALILVRAERFDDAATQLVRCRRALDSRPRGASGEARYYTLLGRTLLGKREFEEGRFALRRAVQQVGVAPEAYFFLGESLAGTNSPDARAAYQRYLELAPQGALADRAARAIR